MSNCLKILGSEKNALYRIGFISALVHTFSLISETALFSKQNIAKKWFVCKRMDLHNDTEKSCVLLNSMQEFIGIGL